MRCIKWLVCPWGSATEITAQIFVSCCYNYQGHNNCMQAAVVKKQIKTWSMTDFLLHYQTTHFTLWVMPTSSVQLIVWQFTITSLYTYHFKSFQLYATHDWGSQNYLQLVPAGYQQSLSWLGKAFFNVSVFGFVFWGGFGRGGGVALFDFHETYEFTLTFKRKMNLAAVSITAQYCYPQFWGPYYAIT